MLRDHARCAIELQHEPNRHVGGDGRRAQRIERVAGGAREQLAVHTPARRPRRNQIERPLGHRQLRRPQRHRQRIERLALIVD